MPATQPSPTPPTTAAPATPEPAAPAPPRFQLRITIYVALAVFAVEMTWSFYDSQVPPLLKPYLSSTAAIGLLMGLDNLLGIFIQPWIGNRSDHTRTRWGRRIPYLVMSMPLAALLFAALPHAGSLPVLIALMFGYAVVANAFRPIATALLPDYIPPEHLGRANAVVKVGTSITVLVAALISLTLVDDHPAIAFAVPAMIMLVAALIVAVKVRDSESPAYRAAVAESQTGPAREPVKVRALLCDIVSDPNRGRLLLLLSIVVFAGCWAASRSLLTPYGTETLGLTRGEAGGLSLPSGIAFLVAAVPSAFLAERIGRVPTVAAGMAVFVLGLVLATVVRTGPATMGALCVAAAGYAAFAINALVVLWGLAPKGSLGAYTGIYTVGSSSGAALGPALVGALVDVTGWRWFFADVGVLTLIAIVVLWRAHGHIRQIAPQEVQA